MQRMLSRWARKRSWEGRWQSTKAEGARWNWHVTEVGGEVRRNFEDGWLEPGMRVLSLGCGDGANEAWVAGQGLTVHGMDFSKTAIARADKQYADVAGLSFSVVDVTKPRAHRAEPYDVVLDRGCLHEIAPELGRMYAANVKRWTKPGGSLILIMRLEGDATGQRRLRQIDDLLAGDFTLVDWDNITIGGEHGETIDGGIFRMKKH